MDALILSCGTGGGHNAAGIAVKEELQQRGHHVTMLNPYDLRGEKLSRRIDRAYISVAQKAPHMFGAVYAAGNWYRRLPCHSPVYFANKRMAGTLQAYLETHPADVVIMTHFFPGEILTAMRDQGMDVPRTILIATDYTCIPFEEECVCDAYVIPSEKRKEEFAKRGVPSARMYPMGIPVSRRFQAAVSREKAIEMLGLDADKRYFLVSGGSIGAGRLKKVMRAFCEIMEDMDFGLIVICGSNERLKQELTIRFGDKAIIIGYTDQMELYLRACDLYFTKPGGLSTTEAAVAEEPLALLPPIPGCESKNLRFFTGTGMAVSTKLTADGLKRTISWLQSDENRQKMMQRQAAEIHKDAAERICDLAEKMA